MVETGPIAIPRPIVLGTDFGPASEAAERAAIAWAAKANVDLVVVHAIDSRRLRLPGGLWRARVDQVRAGRERKAGELVAVARAAGVSARILIWSGEPASCVVEAAAAEGAERIFVGSHRRGRIGQAINGTISQAIVAQAGCPVEVVAVDRPASDRPGSERPVVNGT